MTDLQKPPPGIYPFHPEVVVQMTGEDGNAFAILARVRAAMKAAWLPDDLWSDFYFEATHGDYDHLLQTCMEWVDCK
jgi:hypothetical protein